MKSLLSYFTLSVAVTLLGGCASTELAAHAIKNIPFGHEAPKSAGLYKIGNPYEILGKTYYPEEKFVHIETGISSWYGPQFHGKRTANGEYFNKNELTAAHRTLQMPSLIRVTNLDNGRSLVLRVNDRGPYSRGRVLDVSERAAELLGYKKAGTAKVKIEVLTEASKQVAAAAKRGYSTNGTEIAMNRDGYLPKNFQLASSTQPSKVVTPPSGYQQASYQPSTQTASLDASIGGKAQPVHTQTIKVASLNPDDPKMQAYPRGNVVRSESLEPQSLEATDKPLDFMPDEKPLKDSEVKYVKVEPSAIYIQTGSFTNQDYAENMRSKLTEVSNTVQVNPAIVNGRNFYRVRVGPIPSVDQADVILASVIDRGFESAMIIVD